jgi:ribonuclease Y
MTVGTIIAAILAALVTGVVAFLLGRQSKPDAVAESEEDRKRALAAAGSEADAIKRQAVVEAKEVAQKVRSEVENELRARRQELDRGAAEVRARAEAADRRDREMKAERENLLRKEKQLQAREQTAETVARTAAAQATEARARLEKIAGISEAEARKLLAAEVEDDARAAAASEVKRIEAEAHEEAKQKSQLILGAAVQRYASEYVA